MKKIFPGLFALFFTSCTATFGGAVMVLTFRDAILYVVIALVLAVIISFVRPKEKRMSAFWLWLILNFVLTPLAGIIYLIYLITRKKTPPPPNPPADNPPQQSR